MTEVNTIGLILRSQRFPGSRGRDVSGETVRRRQLRRRQVVAVLQQAAGLSGRYRGLRDVAPVLGGGNSWAHWPDEVRIMPAAYVKPYVKRNQERPGP